MKHIAFVTNIVGKENENKNSDRFLNIYFYLMAVLTNGVVVYSLMKLLIGLSIHSYLLFILGYKLHSVQSIVGKQTVN